MEKRRKFSAEYRDEAVKMVIESGRPIAQVARDLGIVEGTRGNWVATYRREHAGEEPGLSVSERARLRELEREVADLRMERVFLKKAAALQVLLREGTAVSAKYALIDAEKAFYPIARMCVWLSVSRSGFYEWAGRAPGIREQRRTALTGLVEAIFAHSRGTYGARRIAVVLARSGYPASVPLVGRLMAEVGLVACQPRPYKRTTQAGEDPAPVPDLVRRDFTAPAPGTKLVGDITYLRTWTGWCYLLRR